MTTDNGVKPSLPLTCEVVDGAIRITVDAATLKWATEHHDTYWLPDTDTYSVKVADQDEWLQSVARHIEDEREDGSSLLTDLFDKAIEAAVEQGEEGLEDAE